VLICIPTNGDAGLEETVCEHFGSASYFTIYDSESQEVTVVKNRNAHHSHGTCHPMNQLASYRIDGVICGGMGHRAIEALNSQGIKIYQADFSQVGEVIEQIKSGSMREMDPARACRGHGHRGMGLNVERHRPGGEGCCGRGRGRSREGSGGQT
jgi:predicted Fe-Mo cluster-binding NifX family protein